MLKRGLLLITALLLTGCGVQWKYTTLNHAGHTQQFSTVPDFGVEVDTLTFSQLRWKLRTDFNFRYNIAQYALRQPPSFDWNNRLLGNRYSYRNPYLMYNQYWNRTEMWNDWVWGYTGWNSWGSPHRWSPFGYDRWGYGIHYGWNNHGWGWNNYYGNSWYWRTQMNTFAWQNRNRTNTVRVNGRRSSIRNERVNNRRVRTNNTIRINRTNNDTRTIRTNVRNSDVRPPIRTNTPNNNRPVINRNNNRPVINRTNTSPNRRTTPTKNINTTPKRRGN